MTSDRGPSNRPLPTSIGRYRITSRLGKGAMGVVYGAHDDVMDRPVAVKVMMADLEEDPETSARFYREARAAGQLVHRNIITIFDIGDDDGRPFIVMELLEGHTLGEHLKTTDVTAIEHKIDLMVQICEGLRAAHARGIYHRDVKPGNIVVRRDGCLKILDFGIARIASSSMTASGLIVGTPDYMSPEQAVGKEIDHRSDIFSAGAVFYFMLTGRKPFAAPDLPGLFNKLTREDPLPIRDTEAPSELARLVMKALAKLPEQRYQRCDDIIADLTRLRRQLSAETERDAAEVQRHIQDIKALFSEDSAIRERLQIRREASEIEEAWREVCARHAWMDRTDGRMPPDALRHRVLAEALNEVQSIHERLSSELAALEQAERAVMSGRRALGTSQPRAALAHLEQAVRLAPGSTSLAEEADRCRQVVAEGAVNADRARTLLQEAKQKTNDGQWDVAIALCDEALRLSADVVEAKAQRDDIVARQQAERRERAAVSASALTQAEALLTRGLMAEASAALAVARAAGADPAALQAFDHRLQTARLEAEQAGERERQAARAIAAARQTFHEGRRREAIEELETLLRQHPDARGVRDEIVRLAAEAHRMQEDERRAAEAAEHAAAAETALANSDPAQALARADRALAIDPQQPVAARVRAVAAAQIKAAAEKQSRAESAARLLAEAREESARGKFRRARGLIRRADALVPGSPDAAATLDQVNQREVELAQQVERARLAHQRARAAAPALEMARSAEAHEDFVRAAWLAENALALDQDCTEARALLLRARTRLSEQPALADETVSVGSAGSFPADPEDTVSINRAWQPWRRVAEAIRSWSGGHASPRPSHSDGGVPRRAKERF